MSIEKCPYCGSVPVTHCRTKRTVCKCRRMHKYKFNGKIYVIIYKPDGTKEVIK